MRPIYVCIQRTAQYTSSAYNFSVDNSDLLLDSLLWKLHYHYTDNKVNFAKDQAHLPTKYTISLVLKMKLETMYVPKSINRILKCL